MKSLSVRLEIMCDSMGLHLIRLPARAEREADYKAITLIRVHPGFWSERRDKEILESVTA